MTSFETFQRFAACVLVLTYFLQCLIAGGGGEESDHIYPFHAIHNFVEEYDILPESSLFPSEMPGPAQSVLLSHSSQTTCSVPLYHCETLTLA